MILCPQTPHAQRQCCCLVCTEAPHHLAFLYQCSQVSAELRAVSCPKPALLVCGARCERDGAERAQHGVHGSKRPRAARVAPVSWAGYSWMPGRPASPGSLTAGFWRRCGSSRPRQWDTSLCKLGGALRDSQTHVFQSGSSLGIRRWNRPWLRSGPPHMWSFHRRDLGRVALGCWQCPCQAGGLAARCALQFAARSTAVQREGRLCQGTASHGGDTGAHGRAAHFKLGCHRTTVRAAQITIFPR